MVNRTDNDALKRLAVANPQYHIAIGNGLSTGQYFPDVGAGNTKQLYLENPTSDTYYGVVGITARSSAEIRVGKAKNPSEDTVGDPPSTGITNKRTSHDALTAVARVGGDNETGAYSGGDAFNDKGSGGGNGGGNAHPGEIGDGFANIIDPGDSLLFEATNETTSRVSYISLDIDWVEIPESDYP